VGTLADVFTGYAIGDPVECLHCGQVFKVGEEMVDLVDGLLVCPTDGCDGSPLDWGRPGSWGPDSP
jgi:hypothetical protein